MPYASPSNRARGMSLCYMQMCEVTYLLVSSFTYIFSFIFVTKYVKALISGAA